MSLCEDTQYTCGSTKDAILGWRDTLVIQQKADRSFTLNIGAMAIDTNKRYREYTYNQSLLIDRQDFKYVLSDNTYFECFDQNETRDSSIDETYITEDVALFYVDLREDLALYKKITQKMKINKTVKEPIPIKTNYDDTYLYPYIIEEVPIETKHEYMSTKHGVLYTEDINAGYWDGIRILMPLFNGGEPRPVTFVQDGITYKAKEVDWYYIPNHREADGDEFFWWADWHKSVGTYNEIDKREAETMWQVMLGVLPPKYKTTPANNSIQSIEFSGSVAVRPDGSIFLNALFNPQLKIAYTTKLTDSNNQAIPFDFKDTKLHYPIGIY